jgi:hypothetical protein
MTKHFCDLCERPACDMFPEFVLKMENDTWSGSKPCSSGVGIVYGRYTPRFSVRAIFETEDTKLDPRKHFPDLCSNCMASLLRGLLSKVEAVGAK